MSDSLSISGLLEVEVVGIDNIQPSYDASDIRLATAELSLDSKINKNTSGHVLLLWEEGDHSVNVDEGYIVLQSPTGLSLKAGKLYILFGNFESHFISDPLTLELGETNQSSLVLTYTKNMIELSVGAFNGGLYTEGDINIDDIFASLTVSSSKNFTVGVSYLSNLAETDARITYPFMYYAWPNWLVKEVPAISGFANITMGPVNFLIEYLGALEHFSPNDIPAGIDNKDKKPQTLNAELAFMINDSLEVALKAEGSRDFGNDANIPKEQYGMAISYSLAENTSLAFEYLDGRFELKWTDKNGILHSRDRQLYTAQLAIEF